MITELFYPKELKEIIADLRAKGDLNGIFIGHLDNQIIKFLYVYIFGILLFLYTSKPDIALAIAILMPAGMKFDIYRIYVTQIMPYIRGEKKSLLFADSVYYRYGVKLHFIDQNEQKYRTPLITQSKEIKSHISDDKIGTDFECYVIAKKCMPHINKIMVKYCPSKSKMRS